MIWNTVPKANKNIPINIVNNTMSLQYSIKTK